MQKIEDGFVHALYLCKNAKLRDCCARIENVTPLAEFDVNFYVQEGVMTCLVIKTSYAQYHDGKVRKWDDAHFSSQSVREKAYQLWLAHR